MIKRDESNVDNEKRGKLLLLAALLALAMFVFKISQTQSLPIWRTYINSAIYAVVVIVGLLWSFNFQVKKKSILYISQAALFVFSEALFVEMFFFQKFNRLYEAIILLILIGIVFLANYFAFLMVNVLNVNQFKNIPLVQVGRTVSYLISISMIYFFTFSFLVSSFVPYVILPLIVISYFVVTLIHYINTDLDGSELLRKTAITTLISTIILLSVVFSGNLHEVISFAPVVGYYFSVNTVTHEKISNGKVESIYRYIFVLVLLLLVIFLLNI